MDKDGFLIGSQSRGSLSIFSRDVIFVEPKSEKIIEGEFSIDKEMASSASKSNSKLKSSPFQRIDFEIILLICDSFFAFIIVY